MTDITASQASLLITKVAQLLRLSDQARQDGAALLQGLLLMAETQQTHTDILREILAAARDEPAESPMLALIGALNDTLQAQISQLERVVTAIDQLPQRIAMSVQRGIGAAVAGAC